MEDPRARRSLGAALQQQLRRQLKSVVADQQQQEEEEAPDAINVPFPRPAALFRLSSGSSSDGGDGDGASGSASTLASASPPAAPLPFGRFVLPDVKLRKIVRRPIFEVGARRGQHLRRGNPDAHGVVSSRTSTSRRTTSSRRRKCCASSTSSGTTSPQTRSATRST
jgi:hypothetical protein